MNSLTAPRSLGASRIELPDPQISRQGLGQTDFAFTSRSRERTQSQAEDIAPTARQSPLHVIFLQTPVPRYFTGSSYDLAGTLHRTFSELGEHAPLDFSPPKVSYEKHGILVHHGAETITGDEVANALAEE